MQKPTKAAWRKKLADERATLQKHELQLAELAKTIEGQRAAVQEAEGAADKAATELALLAAQLASEHAVPAATPKGGEAAQLQPGFVAIAFAEQKWAEREADFAQKISQLQALLDEHNDASGSAADASSEAPDLDKLEEDEAWNTVEKGKRKALLGRERAKLATKVKAGLNKVSTIASPFKKD